MNEATQIRLKVNGVWREVEVEARRSLADVIRRDLGLTGTHVGCEHGICGTCTVLVDGSPLRSCLAFGVQCDGREVETVEGLQTEDGRLSDIQEAFSRHHGLQCGFCTPGFLMLATAYLDRGGSPDEAEVRDLVSSNLCRCTGYHGIETAIREVARARWDDSGAVGEGTV